MSYSKKEKEIILKLARNAIKKYLEDKSYFDISEIPEKLKEKKACFVTLTIDRELRGCIGNIIPDSSLYKSIIRNAVSAGFHDPRFLPISREEFEKIKIEISVLTLPSAIEYSSKNLFSKIHKKGAIISYKNYSATFLPSVWEQINDEEEFISQLCMKAGLSPDFWKTGKLKIETYETEFFGE